MAEETTILNTQELWTPPKYWQDLTQDEKIERLRKEIKSRDRSNSELTRRIRILEEQFKTHSHNGLGMTAVPPQANQDNYGTLGTSKRADGKEYF
jgi:hypothetical protein